MEILIKEILNDYVDLEVELGGYIELFNLTREKIAQLDGEKNIDSADLPFNALYTLWQNLLHFEAELSDRVKYYHERFSLLHDDNPLTRLQKLNIAACKSGKGIEVMKILEKYQKMRFDFEDLPLGKYRSLTDDLRGILSGDGE